MLLWPDSPAPESGFPSPASLGAQASRLLVPLTQSIVETAEAGGTPALPRVTGL